MLYQIQKIETHILKKWINKQYLNVLYLTEKNRLHILKNINIKKRNCNKNILTQILIPPPPNNTPM